MKPFGVFKVFAIPLFVALTLGVLGSVVMLLWNWLLPSLAGWHTITFLQALALLVLSRVLFGGLRGPRGSWRHPWKERFERMTPEERERFRQGLRQRWHCRGEAAQSDPS